MGTCRQFGQKEYGVNVKQLVKEYSLTKQSLLGSEKETHLASFLAECRSRKARAS